MLMTDSHIDFDLQERGQIWVFSTEKLQAMREQDFFFYFFALLSAANKFEVSCFAK